MVEGPLDLAQIALALLQLIHSVHLAETVHADILGQSKGLCGPLDVPPHGLPGSVLLRAPGALEDPLTSGLLPKLSEQVVREINPAPLSGLLLSDPELPSKLISA